MNSENKNNEVKNLCYTRKYYLAVVRKSGFLPEACDFCNNSFFELFVMKPEIITHSNDDLWLCKACRDKVLKCEEKSI
jgi:hypothetical protein